ncbi:acyltransferase family protein [Pseudonocardia sp. GCM10023141]|uniref:acyltransferase family protein n=1 Tax=Pseudonocardia sp. GCM10023141 TaxID=3252653 RepID=UPI00360A8626
MNHEQYLGLRRFPALDGLRAVAAAMVVFFHFGGPSWERLYGWIGVHIFFVLSGFLITTLALREESRNGRLSIKNFWKRRIARILPAYYVVLAVVAGVALARGEYAGGLGEVMLRYLTLNGEFVGPDAPQSQLWTIGIEQKFYLVWPVLGFAAVLTAARRAAAGIVLLAALLGLAATMPVLVSYIPITLGCLVAVLLHDPRGFRAVSWLTRPLGATIVALVFVAGHLALPIGSRVLGPGGPVIIAYAVLVAVLVVSLVGRGPVGWVLARRPLTFVGDRSYSLYLVQALAGLVVAATIPALGVHRTVTAVVVLAVALLMADLMYRWVEQPAIALGRRWVAAPQRRTEESRPAVAAPIAA